MNTIDAMSADIDIQVDFLGRFKPQKMIPKGKQKNIVICGSGDSLCAAMLAESFSDYSIRALDPLDVIKNKKILEDKRAYFVSVSGNTISNVRAARLGKNRTAITKNPQSRLGKICEKLVRLDYSDSGILTSGTIGFLSCAMTCISLASGFRIENAAKIFAAAKSKSRNITLTNKIYILGNQYTYPIAMYAAAKLGEVLGQDSHYERIEQFLHMGLFTANPGDTIIILEQKNSHTKQMMSHFSKLGLHVYNPSANFKNTISQVLFYTFVSQLIPLNVARKKRIRDCYFITQKKTRAASSDMIY